MKILINKGGQIIGPLSEEETIRRFDKGDFSEMDLAMVEGATGWHELGSYIVQEPIPLGSAPAREQTPSRLVSQSSEAPSNHEPASSSVEEIPGKSAGWRLRTIAVLSTFTLLLAVFGLNRAGFRISKSTPSEDRSAATDEASHTEALPPSEHMTEESKMPSEAGVPEDSTAKSETPAVKDSPGSMLPELRQRPRVVLQRDTMLLFRNEPFRKATAGEEFQVLANRADTGRIYVQETDAAGNVIALSLPAELVAPVANSPADNLAPVEKMPAPSEAATGQVTNTGEPRRGAARPSLSMDVKTIASGGKVRSRNGAVIKGGWDYGNGRQSRSEQYWSTRDRESRVGLSIQVQNFGKAPQELRIESFFMGTPVTGPRTPFLVSKSAESHTVEAGDRLSVEAFSEVARSSTRRDFSTMTDPNPYGISGRVWSAGDTTTGTKVSGWIVRLVADDKVVQLRASSPSLEELAKNPAELDQLAGQMRPARPQ